MNEDILKEKDAFYIAECYKYGKEGFERNINVAFEWFKKSAEQGNSESQYELGLCYYYGKGCEQNLESAFEWFKKSAGQGYDEAIDMIVDCYKDGKGCEENMVEALRWHKKSEEEVDNNRVPHYSLIVLDHKRLDKIEEEINDEVIDELVTTIEILEATVKELRERISELEITVPIEGGSEYQKAKQRFDEYKNKK